MPNYRFPTLVAVFAAIVIGSLTLNPPDIGRLKWVKLKNVKPWESTIVTNLIQQRATNFVRRSDSTPAQAFPDRAPTNLVQSPTGKLASQEITKLEKAYDYQLKQYQQTVGTFQTNLFMQAAFVLFGLLVLFSKEESFEIPLLKLKLQRSWLPFIVPVALLLLWLQFGFLLDSLIKTRIYGWELFLQAASAPGTELSGEYLRSSAALFQDAGFMDGWFTLFRDPDEHLIDTNFRIYHKIFFPSVFGLLLGANHACILGISHVGNARLQLEDIEGREGVRVALLSLPWFMFSLLIISHVLFLFGGPNPNWFQMVIWAIAVILLFVLIRLCRRGKQKTMPVEQGSYDVVAP